MPATFIVGDALTELKRMPDASVDLVMTSPPFLALRSYLPADHPDKAKEIGSEKTPGEYLDVLLDVIVECRRVLAPHGSLVVELGDTYAGSGGGGGDYLEGGMREGQPGWDEGDGHKAGNAAHWRQKNQQKNAWPLDKSLTGIPQLFMLALTYGRNLLTGRELEPWRVRNFSPWVRPNPPVGALGDKFRPATSYLTVACTTRDRWFDLDAVRTDVKRDSLQDQATRRTEGHERGSRTNPGQTSYYTDHNPAGAPPLDWFNIPTAPYKGAHYATYPPDLIIPFIKAMCPQRVCRVCGEPSRRIIEKSAEYAAIRDRVQSGEWNGDGFVEATGRGHGTRLASGVARADGFTNAEYETLGWTECDCYDEPLPPDEARLTGRWRPGVVLDPFCGSGTTLQVATGHGRDAIGIDLDPRNAQLAEERCGMFLTIEDHERVEDVEPL